MGFWDKWEQKNDDETTETTVGDNPVEYHEENKPTEIVKREDEYPGSPAEFFKKLQTSAHRNSYLKGFWIYTPPSAQEYDFQIVTKLALIHSEVSEATDAWRIPNNDTRREGMREELADVVIRTMDLAEYLQIDLLEAILWKMKVNEGRPPRHGKRF